MRKWHNFAKTRNTKNVISVLSYDYYNENDHFNADFATIAYMFVFSIITYYIRICLFPSITPIIKFKKDNEARIDDWKFDINRLNFTDVGYSPQLTCMSFY
jgi:hypothetical protein